MDASRPDRLQRQRPSSLLTRLTSAGAIGTVPDWRRVTVLGLTSSRCRRRVCYRRSLPLPVILTRFAVPLWVLFLGMTDPFPGGAP